MYILLSNLKTSLNFIHDVPMNQLSLILFG